MKTIVCILVIILVTGCVTPVGDNLRIVDLIIVDTQTPGTATQSQGIISRVKSEQANLCYKFDHFQVQQAANFIFEIRSKGTFPEGNPICAQAIYQKDTTLSLATPSPGQYILKFYNGHSLFRSDTVQVN